MLSFLKKPGVSWVVVFLGNPGPKYAGTRHNAGFMASEAFERLHSVKIDRLRFHALSGTCDISDQRLLLLKPQTFMNLSGTSASEALRFYKLPLERLVVVSDDVSLPVGRLRIRRSGSAGGHNGLKDIIAKCGGDGFPRIKIGVGSPPTPEYDMADWVLSTFKNADAEAMAKAAERAAQALETLILHGVDAAMNEYNG